MMPMPAWMPPFVGGMVLMVVLATAWLVWAAASARSNASEPGPWAGRRWVWGLAVLVPLAVLGLYVGLGHPVAANPAHQRQADVSPVTMVDRLAARLQADPKQPENWALLARSYKVLGRYAEAAQAYERAGSWVLQDIDLLVDWIECRMQAAQGHFDARSLELLRQAGQMQAEHEGVWMLSSLAAMDQGDWATARRYLTLMQAKAPAGSPDREAIDHALAQLAQGLDPRLKPLAGPAARP